MDSYTVVDWPRVMQKDKSLATSILIRPSRFVEEKTSQNKPSLIQELARNKQVLNINLNSKMYIDSQHKKIQTNMYLYNIIKDTTKENKQHQIVTTME